MPNEVSKNPMKTRADAEKAAVSLIKPLIPLLSEGKARLHLGETGAVYDSGIAEVEAFARPLWAIVPMLAGKCESVKPIWECWKTGIINGTDPAHPEYWGKVESCDQRLVEMAVFGLGMSIAPDEFYFSLPEKTQDDLYNWLDCINHCEMPHNNWTFFRVLVNMGFAVCGRKADTERLKKDFSYIEEHYIGGGWYHDYERQRDYYTLWAFQYYGLVYAAVMREKDTERAAVYIERAKEIAPDNAAWFDSSGEALPYGRSLSYRFAESAFFAALAFAGAESDKVGFGVMKHLLLGNMRKWFSQPIFTRDGVLTIGYHYPNLIMAEGYNAPGSPYWAMKSFLCLALPETHPFWQSEEEEYHAPQLEMQPQMKWLVSRSGDNSHVIAYPAGNVCTEHAHPECKYEKFAYSTLYGFSVKKSQIYLHNIANDSMLALSEDNIFWHTRFDCREYEVFEDHTRSVWTPFAGVRIETLIYPCEEWHIRIHRIISDRHLYAAEGGFAYPNTGDAWAHMIGSEDAAGVSSPQGTSIIKGIKGYKACSTIKIVMARPNKPIV